MGTLTYLDYGSGKEVSIKSSLTVKSAKSDGRAWDFDFIYPDEPNANESERVTLSADGRSLNNENVVSARSAADGTLKVVTEVTGKDNGKDATIRHTYSINESSFSIRKEVRLVGSTDFFVRNVYSWVR